jgi:DNA-binding beta-propeller fold protein YncE
MHRSRAIRRPVCVRLSQLVRMLAVATAMAGAGPVAATALAAPPSLAPSVVGEPPHGGGVFRFPQAVAVSPGGSTVFVGDQYSGVVQAFGPDGTPRFDVGARAARREPGRLGVVGGVATDRAGHLYVLDSEHERVQVFSAADGHPLASFGDASTFDLIGGDPTTGAGISASGLAVLQASPSAAPVVYVADQGNDRVERFELDPGTLTPSGPPRISPPGLGLAAPQGLALDPAGTRLYVADDDNHRVVVLDPSSLALTAQAGGFGTGPGQFQNPYDVAVDAHDPPQLYVADNLNGRVDVLDAGSLAFLGTFGRMAYGPGVGNLEIVRSVGALADTPGGGVDVADTANNRIQAFDASGAVTAAWGLAGRGPGYVTRPGGVAVAADGSIAVADAFDQRVALFAPDGTYGGQRGLVSSVTGYAFQGSAPGQFSLPSGAAYDGGGNLWVADTGNDRVVQLDPGGGVLRTTPPGLLARPLAVATAPAGTYVADTGHGRVVLLAPDGSATVVRSGLAAPAAVAVAADGTPFVADDASVRNAATGAAVPAPGGAPWDHPSGLAVDAAGTLYVSERRPGTPDGARVLRGTPAGGGAFTWDTLATEGAGTGQVISPAGLAVSPDGGTLVVADAGNDRVLRFDAPGHGPAPQSTLRVAIDQLARGTVVSDQPGIACVTDCRQAYGTGRTVTLTAAPAAGSVFAGWGGACAAAAATPACSVALSGDADVTASFAAAPPPAPPVAAAPAPAVPAPVRITSVHLGTHRLHLTRRRDPRRHRKASPATRTRATVTLTVPAVLAVGVQRRRAGRRQGSSCRAPTRANRRRARCSRWVALARRRTLRAGGTVARFTLTPSFGASAALKPGSYRLAATALDARGNRVGPATGSFRIVR